MNELKKQSTIVTKEDVKLAKEILRSWGETDSPITAQAEFSLKEAIRILHNDRLQREARKASHG